MALFPGAHADIAHAVGLPRRPWILERTYQRRHTLEPLVECHRQKGQTGAATCRNIRTLFNIEPPATTDEVQAAALRHVCKISGFTRPSRANEAAFLAAVEEIARVSAEFLVPLETTAAPKNREEEAAKAGARAAQPYGS